MALSVANVCPYIYTTLKFLALQSRYSDWLRAGLFGIESRWGARFSAPVQTGPGAHPASVQWVPGLSRG
jgi:hypothetical protein